MCERARRRSPLGVQELLHYIVLIDFVFVRHPSLVPALICVMDISPVREDTP